MSTMNLDEVQSLSHAVRAASFVLAGLTGWLIHRGHFCTMGAISDWVVMRDATRVRQWVLALAVTLLGFGLMSWAGWISPLQTIYASPRLNWLSALLGGMLFGVGMVWGSGCASKSLVRLGAGNLKSLVVLLSMAVFALATLRGLTAVWRVSYLDSVAVELSHGPLVGQWVATWLGVSLATGVGVSAVLVCCVLLVWVLRERSFITSRNLITGVGLGLLMVALWWVSGVLGFVPEHPETLEPVFLTTQSGRMEAMSFTAPMAYWLDAFLYYSDGSKRLSLGMVTVAGVITGSALSARAQGTFRWEGFSHTADLMRHLAGGAFMGIGAILAMGCTFGQGLTGLSTLSLGSALAVLGMVSGAAAALQWQIRQA